MPGRFRKGGGSDRGARGGRAEARGNSAGRRREADAPPAMNGMEIFGGDRSGGSGSPGAACCTPNPLYRLVSRPGHFPPQFAKIAVQTPPSPDAT